MVLQTCFVNQWLHFKWHISFYEHFFTVICYKYCEYVMSDFREQYICIKFCFNLKHQSQTYDWFKCFKDRWTLDNDHPHSGQPSTSITPVNVTAVHSVIVEDHTQTTQDICNIVRLSYNICQRILSDELNMRHTVVKFIP